MRRIIFIVALITCMPLLADELQIANATVRQPLPGRSVSAGYFTMTNASDKTVSLVAASSAWFEKVELHQHSFTDGMMRMQRIDTIDVAPSETVHLQPGGLHLMLFSPKQPLPLDQQVPIELTLADGQKIAVMAVITKIPKQ